MPLTFWVLFFALSVGSSKCFLLGAIPKRKRAVAKRRSSARILNLWSVNF